jgi:hypothetical protein
LPSRKGCPNKREVGPFSKHRTISLLDLRSRAGRVLKQTRDDSVAHVGGNPFQTQALIIQAASLKATRLFLLQEKLLDAGETKSEDHILAWANSLRLDCVALGLEPRQKVVGPTLAKILKEQPIEIDEAAQ